MSAKILVIEDEFQIRENIADLLTLTGFDVLTAADGQEGIQNAVSWHPDLILCDVFMPLVDGFQVLASIRRNQSVARTKFVFLTAKADIADFNHGMALGADDYLIKPFKLKELLAIIQSRI